jgi:hypothetical protein
VVFGSLLFVVVAVPAIAEQGTGGIPLPPPPPPGTGDSDGGGGSAAGYPDASQTQAESLFTSDFSQTVDSLAADPPDLSGEHPTFLNDHTAFTSPGSQGADLVSEARSILEQDQRDLAALRSDLNALLDTQGAGAPRLVASTMPLRARDGDGQQAPIDLSLDQQGGNYAPDNPLVDLTLPGDLSHDIAVGDQGIKVDVGETDPASADPIAGGNLFYADAAPATDVVLAPVTPGLETLYQLRAPESPNHFRMTFTLPTGAQLEAKAGGGAAIVSDGQTLATVFPPVAQDAAGNAVFVTASVSGDSIDIDVPHSDPDIRYPISVDPVIDGYTWSTNGSGAFADWIKNQTVGSPYQLKTACTWGVNCQGGLAPVGLYIAVPPGQTVAANSIGAWQYRVPHYPETTAYISALDLGPMHFFPRYDTATNPFMFAGIFANATSSYLDTSAQSTNASNLYWSLDPGTATTGKQAVFALWSWTMRTVTDWRDAYLGGATVSLSDTEKPTANVDTGPLTQGWIDGTRTVNFAVDVSDGGLGVKGVYAPGPDGYDTTSLPSQNDPSHICLGTHARLCPQSGTVTAGYYPGKVPEGQSATLVLVWDPFNWDHTSGLTWNVRVDASPPQISTSGGLSQSGGSDPYKLHVDATDGDGSDSSGAAWRSGVRSIEVDVNGQEVADTGAHDCTPTAGSCPLSLDYTPDPSDFSTDQLHFKVIAIDELGHTQTKEWDVTLPDTSIDSGPNGPTSATTPSFTYSSTVAGSTFQCRVDSDPFSSCPASGYTSEHLDDGQHAFYVRATDSAGHVDQSPAERGFNVDTASPQLTTGGELVDTADALVGAGPAVEIDATDAGTGVVSVRLLVDGQEEDELAEDCPDGGCAIQGTLLPDLGGQTPGSHSFEIVATDGTGNTTHEAGPFRLDPTPPVLAVTGELADYSGQPLPSDTASADIQTTDSSAGDSGIANLEVSVDGGVDASIDPSCDPSCPPTASTTYTYQKSDWGSGPHELAVGATDAAGNVRRVFIDVDVQEEKPPAECPESTPTVEDPIHTVSVSEAEEGVIASALAPSEPSYAPDAETTLDPSLSRPDDSPPTPLEVSGSLTSEDLASLAAGGFRVDRAACLVPTQTTTAETNAAIVNGDSALYANSAADTDTVVRPTAAGETVVESLRSDDAPDSFSWNVGIQDGNQLQQLASGAVAVVDPSKDAPSDLQVPDPPQDAQDPAAIPDVDTQLAVAQYEVAQAEQETGQFVAAVIMPPYTVDGAGTSQPSTLTLTSADTVTVDAGSNTTAVVLSLAASSRAPDPVKAWYMYVPPSDAVQVAKSRACKFAQEQPSGDPAERVLLIDFGAAHQFTQDVFGAIQRDRYKYRNSLIFDALKGASSAYQGFCYRHGQARITYGNSNNMTLDTNAERAGTRQAVVAGNVDAYQRRNEFPLNNYDKEDAAVAGDIEPVWQGPGKTKKLVDAASTGGGGRYYDFGNAKTINGWGLGDIGDVSFTSSLHRRPLSEIYARSDADDWHRVQQHWNEHHASTYYFGGVTATPDASLDPGAAWRLLDDVSNGHLFRQLVSIRDACPTCR